MHPFLKYSLRLSAIFIVALLLIKPYNLYCNTSGSCVGFNITKYLPSSESHSKVKVKFVNINRLPYIDFQVMQKELYTVPGRKNAIGYTLTNVATIKENPIEFSIKYAVIPAKYQDYIKRYECLCHKSYKLKQGQSKQEEIIFKIKKDFEEIIYEEGTQEIEIRYEIIYK